MVENFHNLKSLVAAELIRIGDPARRAALRALLFEPSGIRLDWNYGGPSDSFDCGLVGRSADGHVLLVYCEHGFGPSFPWGYVYAGERSMGMDSQWHSGLIHAAIGAGLISEPPGYEVPGPRECYGNGPADVESPVDEHLVIRLGVADDVESLVALRATFLAEVASADPTDPALLSALRRYFAAAVPAGEFVAALAVHDGRVVASSGLVYHRHPPSPGNLAGCEAYVMNMYTLPAWRGRGLATALLARLVDVARAGGCCRVVLHALPLARAVYDRAGFVPADGEMRLDLRGTPGA